MQTKTETRDACISQTADGRGGQTKAIREGKAEKRIIVGVEEKQRISLEAKSKNDRLGAEKGLVETKVSRIKYAKSSNQKGDGTGLKKKG